MARPGRPVQVERPFPMTLATSLDQRSPQRCGHLGVVGIGDQAGYFLCTWRDAAVQLAGANTVCLAPCLPVPRWMCPGAGRLTVMQLGMQPSVLPHPATCAMVSSFIQFCNVGVKLRLDPGGPRLLYALLDFLLRGTTVSSALRISGDFVRLQPRPCPCSAARSLPACQGRARRRRWGP
jgi:hypothetical protein